MLLQFGPSGRHVRIDHTGTVCSTRIFKIKSAAWTQDQHAQSRDVLLEHLGK